MQFENHFIFKDFNKLRFQRALKQWGENLYKLVCVCTEKSLGLKLLQAIMVFDQRGP